MDNQAIKKSRVLEPMGNAVTKSADAAREAKNTCYHLCKTVRSLVLTTLLIGQAGVGMVQNTYDTLARVSTGKTSQIQKK